MTVNVEETGGGGHLTGRPPGYSSVTSLRTLFDNLHENGLPLKFDRSFWGSASGGLIAQTRGALRFLDLIDDGYRPTELLRQLVDADEPGRKAILRRLAEERYPQEIRLSEQSGTHGQLLTLIRERGLNGATADKAATFFVHLSDYTGLPISPYFTQGRRPSAVNGAGASARRTGRSRRRPPGEQTEAPAVPRTETLEAKRSAYVDLLMKLASRNEGELPPPELLDRIERALGYREKSDGGQAGEMSSETK